MYVYDEKRNIWVPLRSTRAYRRKRKQVRDTWILLSLIMLIMPFPANLALALFGGFLSLTYLDESVYDFTSEDEGD